jgi:1-acyl-sn-glycerol-3-phosphate acyltransferase
VEFSGVCSSFVVAQRADFRENAAMPGWLEALLIWSGVAAAGAVVLAVALSLVCVVVGFLATPQWGRPLVYDGTIGVFEAWMRGLLCIVHRARLLGFDRSALPAGGYIVVANHNSGLDAPLMQFAVPRRVRFMMARDQMHPWFRWLWRRLDVLPVHYGPEDAGMLRQAVRHVKEGGVVGLFPERGIAKEKGTIDPFAEGVGTLVALTKAPVVLCWFHGARTTGSALIDPFVPRGQAIVEYVGTYDFAAEGIRDPKQICDRLREVLSLKSGWERK